MTGNMQKATLLVEPIPNDCTELLLRLPVNVLDLGTWCVPARVTRKDGQAVWCMLVVRGLETSNTGIKVGNG